MLSENYYSYSAQETPTNQNTTCYQEITAHTPPSENLNIKILQNNTNNIIISCIHQDSGN